MAEDQTPAVLEEAKTVWMVYGIMDGGRLALFIGTWHLDGGTYNPGELMPHVAMDWLNANAPGALQSPPSGGDVRFHGWAASDGAPMGDELLAQMVPHDLGRIDFTIRARACVGIVTALVTLEDGGALKACRDQCQRELDEERAAPSDYFLNRGGEHNLVSNIAMFDLLSRTAREAKELHTPK